MTAEPSVTVKVGVVSQMIEGACLLGAALLLAGHITRCYSNIDFQWWIPFVVVAAGLAADLLSGLVHWAADTWGQETMPVLGPRFLRPFRVHHLNPGDFLRRNFIDCNGDVAMLVMPVLGAGLWIPLTAAWGSVAEVWLVSFSIWTLPTNQVHQWAHMPSPPRPIQWLQRHGVILSPEAHARHHEAPYAINYCIATGWCNQPFTAIGFFHRMERAVTRLTGWQPREDDRAFAGKP